MLKKLLILQFFLFIYTTSAFAEESITLTTYYPSPYGSYYNLSASNNVTLATVAGSRVGIGTSTPGDKLDVNGNIYYRSEYVLGQIVAQASCTAINPSGGYTWSVRRECSALTPDCTTVCANLGKTCFNSLHIYGNQPHTAEYQLGLQTYRYEGCGGGCGPNYCCCE